MAADIDNTNVSIGEVVASVAQAFPTAWAEPWDRVGLLAGDQDEPVHGVLVSLDPTPEVIARAHSLGANLLFTHHPAYLEAPQRIVAGPGAAGLLHMALSHGIALAAAHTNLDRAPAGAGVLLEVLGLPPGVPVERSVQSVARIVTYVPESAADHVRAAMVRAGAGRIGEYEGCSFTSAGLGRYVPGLASAPVIGTPGRTTETAEERVEMVCDPASVAGVVENCRLAHPYEEPLITITDSSMGRGVARLGRVTDVEHGTLASLVARVSDRLKCTPRVWGQPDAKIDRVATATGSAGSLISDAISSAADVLIAGEVRYHDALDALARGLAIIEAGHDVTEWPLVPVLAGAIKKTPGINPGVVYVDDTVRRWWTP
ncbi:MAG: Nif3-like dinuclear metal center hexameric protein [Coriobacteriia bacterium]|nr:Nif3-like dinuclear metal center hexameric protein [Coriobacteriia bacterium]